MSKTSWTSMVIMGLWAPIASSILHLAFLTIINDQGIQNGIPYYFAVLYFASASSGSVLACILGYLSVRRLLVISECFKILILSLVMIWRSYGSLTLPLLLISVYFLQVADIFIHTNKYHLLNLLVKDLSLKNYKISRLQMVETSSGITGPLLASLCFWIFSIKVALIVPAVIYGAHIFLWLSFSGNVLQERSKYSWYEGFQTILSDKRLITLLLARLVGNVPFIMWSILLPLIVQSKYPGSEFTAMQAIALSFMSMGLFSVNFLVPKLWIDHVSMEEKYIRLAPFPILVSVIILLSYYFGYVGFFGVLVSGFLFGISNGSFRTGGIVLGQKITPPSVLHLVMAAGDGIVRIVSGMIAMGVGYLLENHLNNTFNYTLSMLLCCITALVAFYFYSVLVKNETSLINRRLSGSLIS